MTAAKGSPYSGWYSSKDIQPPGRYYAHLPGVHRQGVHHTACGEIRGRRVPRKALRQADACLPCVLGWLRAHHPMPESVLTRILPAQKPTAEMIVAFA